MNVRPVSPPRIHFLDNLRAVAMLLGVYLHGALAYAEPARSVWIATDPQGSVAIDASIWWIHLFRMQLFFLLSGYFAELILQRKGVGAFLAHRALRIALPFLLFWPLVRVAMMIVFVFAFTYVCEPQGLLGWIVSASRDPEAAGTSAPLTTMHLWFLYYLMMFSLLAAAGSRWCRWNTDWLFGRGWLLLLAPLALVPGVIGGGVPTASPESFVPLWWPFASYGLFYWFGWQLSGREWLLERLQPWCWWLVVAGVLLFVPWYRRMPRMELPGVQTVIAAGSFRPDLLEALLGAYLSAFWTIAALLLGQRYLARSSPGLRFCADASYWVYLIHLPIVLFLQTLLIPLALPVVLKLVIVTLGTWLFCMATYVVFVRYTPVGWMLNGKRPFP